MRIQRFPQSGSRQPYLLNPNSCTISALSFFQISLTVPQTHLGPPALFWKFAPHQFLSIHWGLSFCAHFNIYLSLKSSLIISSSSFSLLQAAPVLKAGRAQSRFGSDTLNLHPQARSSRAGFVCSVFLFAPQWPYLWDHQASFYVEYGKSETIELL